MSEKDAALKFDMLKLIAEDGPDSDSVDEQIAYEHLSMAVDRLSKAWNTQSNAKPPTQTTSAPKTKKRGRRTYSVRLKDNEYLMRVKEGDQMAEGRSKDILQLMPMYVPITLKKLQHKIKNELPASRSLRWETDPIGHTRSYLYPLLSDGQLTRLTVDEARKQNGLIVDASETEKTEDSDVGTTETQPSPMVFEI